jgi:hypothetical protein
MKILAIDPGCTESAYVQYNENKIEEFGKVENQFIYSGFTWADKILIEMVASYGMPVGREVFETVLWIGKFVREAELMGVDVELVYRKDIKLHHCGSTRAKDSNIIQALKDKYGDKGTKNNPGFFYGFSKDVWQAFALASYYAEVRL